ncbi:hypothetical protein PWKp7_00017 [Klebsiella phage PWKp7]|nr:hypothetical protein PWKp2_00010 [Klebsiella phage PWKp2]UJD04963.1 hypothetical protein PWKp7_00017 [Klebsiella phage PWKp7]UJD05048.1 hypothetical protein PWKp9B_00048 [Klebsiella phage PWKp9B]
MRKQNLYDVYKRPNGLLYRVPLDSPLHKQAELFRPDTGCWWPSAHKVGGVISSDRSTLVARNVVFKDRVCSQ